MLSPYDFNQAIGHRIDFVEERLQGGSPVVGLSFEAGVLIFTVRRTQRKVFEIYDQIIYSAIGNQTDVESLRLAAIDFAHQEGFSRSVDDVSLQRLVGFGISPGLKRSFGDPMASPPVIRALFAELGSTPPDDAWYPVNYDGEFQMLRRGAVLGGTTDGEAAMEAKLKSLLADTTPCDLAAAARIAWEVWGEGLAGLDPRREATVRELRDSGLLEAGLLERHSPRESRFRLLDDAELRTLGLTP